MLQHNTLQMKFTSSYFHSSNLEMMQREQLKNIKKYLRDFPNRTQEVITKVKLFLSLNKISSFTQEKLSFNQITILHTAINKFVDLIAEDKLELQPLDRLYPLKFNISPILKAFDDVIFELNSVF